jgi:pimeloyl-ACP methyl ester carboxylesterase
MIAKISKIISVFSSLFFCIICNAQNFLEVSIPGVLSNEKVRLEYYEYIPEKWNGHLILMSHGSTGGNAASIKTSFRFLNISRIANQYGFAFLAFNRKGRGKSEGSFTEESGKCDFGSLSKESQEALDQLRQVVAFAKEKFKVDKVVLMGHSRGGFLSSYYAGKFPADVSAVVNLAGAWTAVCEQKNGGFAKYHFESSAKIFKNQYWIYFDNDSYFSDSKFGDPNYRWFRKISENNNLEFHQFSDGGRPDGHQAPTYAPKEWSDEILPKLVKKLIN